MNVSIRHTGIVVTDLDKAIYLWQDVLGLSVRSRAFEDGPFISTILSIASVSVTTVKLDSDTGQCIELLKYHSLESPANNHPLFGCGITHIALTVDDLEECLTKLQGCDLDFLSDPQISPCGLFKVLFVRVHDGIILELVEPQSIR